MKLFAKAVALIAIFLFALPISVSAKEIEAPFGLKWGQSKSELESLGVQFSECKTIKTFLQCRTESTPKAVSFADFYYLLFHVTKGLQKTTMVGNDITNDITGSQGTKLYTQVKKSLIRKYGQPTSEYEYFGRELYDEHDEFYQCLEYSGCGAWTSFWESTDGGALSLRLRGLGRGKGYVRMAYESKMFSNLLDDAKSKEAATDEDAF